MSALLLVLTYILITSTSVTGIHAGSSYAYNVSTIPISSVNIESPLEQIKSGISPNNVVCKEEFQLVIKAEDGSPACVTSDTAQKLIERGWARELTNIVKSEIKTNPPLKILSLSEIPPFPPGGAKTQLSLLNTGTDPITSINATLKLNNQYVYNFKNITEAKPLASGASVSDYARLTGAVFSTGMKYPLIIFVTVKNETSSYTMNVEVPCNANC